MNKIKNGRLSKIINITLPIVIVAGAIALLLQNYLYNSRERVCDFSKATYEGTSMIFDDFTVNIAPRGDDTSSWVSTDIYANNGTLVYKSAVGKIYDLELLNNSVNEIYDWNISIRIPEEMCVSDTWNGEVELHQNVNSGSKQVQTIKFSQYSKYDITLEHYITYVGLMVKLYGDRFKFCVNSKTDIR